VEMILKKPHAYWFVSVRRRNISLWVFWVIQPTVRRCKLYHI